MSIFDSVSGSAVATLPTATRNRAKGPASPFLPTLQGLLENGGAYCYPAISVVPAEVGGASTADELTKELRAAARQVVGTPGKTVQMKTRRMLSADRSTADIYVAVGYKDVKESSNGETATPKATAKK